MKDMESEFLAAVLLLDESNGGQIRPMVDELALQSERWRALKARALRINNPLPPLPDLEIPEVLPVPGARPFGEFGGFSQDEDIDRAKTYWREQAGKVAA
ncbi:hypothetical protein [Sphingorhabdus sp. 109]|uniref:hypothetical protein n=1 Tax=Sphingorhabdus sp. 109 TaxID=2653173 RepID=UPI0012EFFB6E|nr:hypothetical protein [Sphingorhabdus sp. 109]VWX56700.1 hypothetical protein SPHINGOR109_10554 [Sphingorhabdus sp. 109]